MEELRVIDNENYVSKNDEYLSVNSELKPELLRDFNRLKNLIYNSAFSDMLKIETYEANDATLGVKKETNTELKPLTYDAKTNNVVVNDLVFSDYDTEHWSLVALLQMATNHKNALPEHRGLTKNNNLIGLDEGLCENMAESLVGNDGVTPYEDEKIVARLLCQILGDNELKKCFFNSNPEELVEKMHLLANNNVDIDKMLYLMNANYKNHTNGGKSSLGEIERMCIDLFMQKPNLTEDTIARFEENLYGNPAVFVYKEAEHESVLGVNEYFAEQLKTKLNILGKQA